MINVPNLRDIYNNLRFFQENSYTNDFQRYISDSGTFLIQLIIIFKLYIESQLGLIEL